MFSWRLVLNPGRNHWARKGFPALFTEFRFITHKHHSSALLCSQAVNKLAEVMHRKLPERGNETQVYKRKNENRKLELELRAEKEKLNSTIIKYQREMTEMQAVSVPTYTY